MAATRNRWLAAEDALLRKEGRRLSSKKLKQLETFLPRHTKLSVRNRRTRLGLIAISKVHPASRPAPDREEKPATRACLGPLCRGKQDFASTGVGNRVCARCRKAQTTF